MLKKLVIIPLGAAALVYTLAGLYLSFGRTISTAVYILLPIVLIFPLWLLPLSHVLPSGKGRRLIHRAAESVIGVCLYLLIVLFFLATYCLLCRFTPLPLPPLAAVTAAAIALPAFFLGIGALNARHLRKVRHTLHLRGEKPGRIKAVVFSDLHLGFFTTKGLLERLTKAVNEENADYIFFAGDLFDSDYEELRNESEALEALKAMRAVNGFYACPGNHDAYAEKDERQERFIKAAGIRLLKDEAVSAPLFTLYGRLDRYKEGRASAEQISRLPRPLIVLDHQTDDIPALLKAGAALVLCGHTHNGQTFPGNIVLRVLNRYSYGLHEKGGHFALTTSGAGYWGIPLRLFTQNEIVILDIFFE